MSGNIPEAYARLRIVLAQRNMTVFQLHRQLEGADCAVNIKSLYRLASEEPLQKVDLRIAAAICRACDVDLGELITFEKPRPQLRRIDARTQARLEELMAKNNDGKLTANEKREFAQLAERAHRISLENARVLQAERRRSGRSRTRATRRREAVAA
jgi:DNA-binding Xre family transcriptional regulator